jgi:hypothetical protein
VLIKLIVFRLALPDSSPRPRGRSDSELGTIPGRARDKCFGTVPLKAGTRVEPCETDVRITTLALGAVLVLGLILAALVAADALISLPLQQLLDVFCPRQAEAVALFPDLEQQEVGEMK